MKTLFTIISFILPLSTYAYKLNLTAQELTELRKGKEIERVVEVKGEVFPKVILVNVIPHTPAENMSVYSQFENHTKFVPNLVNAKVVNKVGNSTDVAFEMEMPIVNNTKYTTRNTIEEAGNDRILTWDLVKSKQVKATKGMVAFEEFEGKTLFTYVSHISPDSSFAWAVKSRVLPDIKKNIDAVIDYLGKNAGK
jgi:ribosome-associated toxin RatA of RatAB toxin-antitoxin module